MNLKNKFNLKNYIKDIRYNMGNYFSRKLKYFTIPLPDNAVIKINQAYCYTCHTLLVDNKVCKCGNVEVYGDLKYLRRKVVNKDKYCDFSLIEYKGK
jgi:hypothetical protein